MAITEPQVCVHGVLLGGMRCEICMGPGYGSWIPGSAPNSISVPMFPAHPAPVQQGWECPKCHHVFAPFMPACSYCPSGDQVVTNAPDFIAKAGDGG